MKDKDYGASLKGSGAEGADVVATGASLTDKQCADIAAWAKTRWAATGDRPAIVVDRDKEPGRPQALHNSDTLYAHPADFLALVRWAEAQNEWPLDVYAGWGAAYGAWGE